MRPYIYLTPPRCLVMITLKSPVVRKQTTPQRKDARYAIKIDSVEVVNTKTQQQRENMESERCPVLTEPM